MNTYQNTDHSKPHNSLFRGAAIALICGSAFSFACSSSDTNTPDGGTAGSGNNGGSGGNSGAAGTSGTAGTPDGGAGSPSVIPSKYAVITQVFGSDGGDNSSYITVLDELSGGPIDLTTSIELSGRAIGVGVPGLRAVLVGGDGSATLQRYDLDDSGKLIAGPSLSFEAAGLSQIGEYAGQIHVVSSSLAYFFDGSTAQVMVFNPETMKNIKTIDLQDLIHTGELLTFGGDPIFLDGKIYAFAGWRTQDNTQIPSRAGVVIVDTKDNSVKIVEDTRCGYVRDGAVSEGYIYLATEAFATSVYHMNNDNAPAPCMLRFNVQSGAFDTNYKQDLSAVLGDGLGGTLLRDEEGQAYLLKLDASDYAGPAVPRVLASSAQWNLYQLELGDTATASAVTSAPRWPGSILPSHLSGGTILPIFEGRSKTGFYGLDAGEVTTRDLSVDGLSFSVAELR